MNRHGRRTDGKAIINRISQLRNSRILNDPRIVGLTEESINSLKDNTHPDKDLQILFDKSVKLVNELVNLEAEMYRINKDYAEKTTGNLRYKQTTAQDSEEHQPDLSV